MRRVALTDHAIARFQERVRPTLTLEQAETELRRLLPMGEFREEIDWRHENADDDTDGFLVLSDGVALALIFDGHYWHARTCLTRAEHAPEARRIKSLRRKRARRTKWGDRELAKGRSNHKRKARLRHET